MRGAELRLMLLLDTRLPDRILSCSPGSATYPLSNLAVATITVMEIRFGLLVCHKAASYRSGDTIAPVLTQAFAGRVLAFAQPAADACAEVRVHRYQAGNPISIEGGMIAAIARCTSRGPSLRRREKSHDLRVFHSVVAEDLPHSAS
jgi:predicted nucleic acid-binding protein